MTISRIPPRRKTAPGYLLFTLLILALVLIACSSSDAEREGGVSQTPRNTPAQVTESPLPTIPVGPPPPPPLISKALEPSSSVQTLSWNDSVTVTIPGGLLDEGQTLAIAPVQDLPEHTFDAIAEMAGYTITLGDVRQFENPIAIEMAYDPSKLPEGLPPQKALFASYWDPGQELWVYVPVVVDIQRNVATITTHHLTAWRLYYVARGYGVKETEHFLVVYDKQTYPIVGSREVDAASFSSDVSDYLEQAYVAYVKAGFKIPSGQTHVFVDKNTEESQRSGLTGSIYLATTHDSAETLKHEAAHELFHVVQNRYFNVYGMGWRKWWVEATADYAASEIVWKGQTELPELDHMYLKKSIAVSDGKHEYKTANFVAFLAKHGVDFKGMWDAVAGNTSPRVLRPLDTYVQDQSRTTLHSQFRQFVRYVLFDPKGPIDHTEKLLYSGFMDQPDFLEVAQRDATYTFNLLPDYTASAWGLRVRTKDEQAQRLLHLEIIGTPPPANQVQADVVVLPDDVRPQGGASPRGTLDATNPKMDLRVGRDDVVYIVAANSSGSGHKLTVKITVDDPPIAISPETVALAPGASHTFSATVNGKMPGAGVILWNVDEGASGGDVNSIGRYTAPNQTGTYHVTASLASDGLKKATATITVSLVTLKMHPTTATVMPGGKQAFIAEVSGNPDTSVSWRVEERGGGTITPEGVYTAPTQEGVYHVVVTSRADPKQTLRATVSVVEPTPTPLQVTLTLSPAEAILVPGAKQEFRATLSGVSDTSVEWRVPGNRQPIQAADIPVTFIASTVGEYTVSVTSIADPTKRVEAKVKVVPGVWVLVDKAETTMPNVGGGVSQPGGSVSLSAGSAEAVNQTGSVVSKWRLTWTEPPLSLVVGQKFSGAVSAGDNGSAYDKDAMEFPSGSSSMQMRLGNKSVGFSVAGAGRQGTLPDYPFLSSASQSFELVVPAGRADGPQLEVQVSVVAHVGFGDGVSWTQMRGEVVYLYELRAQ